MTAQAVQLFLLADFSYHYVKSAKCYGFYKAMKATVMAQIVWSKTKFGLRKLGFSASLEEVAGKINGTSKRTIMSWQPLAK